MNAPGLPRSFQADHGHHVHLVEKAQRHAHHGRALLGHQVLDLVRLEHQAQVVLHQILHNGLANESEGLDADRARRLPARQCTETGIAAALDLGERT